MHQNRVFLLKFLPMSFQAGPSTTLQVFAIISRIYESYFYLQRCCYYLDEVVKPLALDSVSLFRSLNEKLLVVWQVPFIIVILTYFNYFQRFIRCFPQTYSLFIKDQIFSSRSCLIFQYFFLDFLSQSSSQLFYFLNYQKLDVIQSYF